MMNNVTVVVGSHREDSQSLKIGTMMRDKLSQLSACSSVSLINLATANLPFWQESYTDEEQALIQGARDTLQNSDAFVFVVPEWNGMVPSAMKNLFLLFSGTEFGHKPGLIASVSAGIGGTYPITEMRTTYKNSRINYLPEHLIFRDVGNLFNNLDSDDKSAEDYMSQRTDYCLEYLMLYSKALKEVRASAPDGSDFANGM